NQSHFDYCISDNCYGIHTPNSKNILITHQLNLPLNGIQKKLAQKKLDQSLNPFHEIWVPDSQGLFSDLLSRCDLTKVEHIGSISRFSNSEPIPNDCTVMISGPEPRRSELEAMVLDYVIEAHPEARVHLFSSGSVSVSSERLIIHSPHDPELPKYIKGAGDFYCSSGYSTLMDLVALRKVATLIPTPGQPEQEFLAQHWHEKFRYPIAIAKNKKLEVKAASSAYSLPEEVQISPSFVKEKLATWSKK
ncbi:MAG: hypothetical protein HRT74_11575, partial [Flavobacteriales bacterium]|nr:hypothetical protein [Flavobacteriales bacterium]